MTIKNSTSNSAKHNARCYALQAMYQWQLSDAAIIDIENEFLIQQITKKVDLEYFKNLIHGIPKQFDELNQEITPFLKRSIKEVDPIEIAILRIATYELKNHPEIPYRVVINEALEITKTFGSSEGFKFVNSILDPIAKKLRATEIRMKGK